MIMMKHISKKVKPLHITLTKTNTYVNIYDGQIKWRYVLIENDDLLEKYNTIWEKDSVDIKNQFDSQSVYNKQFLQTKMKSHGDKIQKILNSLGKFSTQEKIRNSGENSQLKENIFNSRENSQIKKDFSTDEKTLNCRENSSLKFSTKEKILSSRENSQLNRKRST